MKLIEVLKTRMDLEWQSEPGGELADFVIDEQEYRIVIAVENVEGLTFVRVDFSAKVADGYSLNLTGYNRHQFKVLGIVSNGVKERFPDSDGYYFVAKRSYDPEGYVSRVTAYRRIADRLRVEMQLSHHYEERQDETIFYLARTDAALMMMMML